MALYFRVGVTIESIFLDKLIFIYMELLMLNNSKYNNENRL